MDRERGVDFTPARTFRGRALLIAADGALFVGRGQRIFRSVDHGASWRLDSQVPNAILQNPVLWPRLLRRALRYQISGLIVLSDGTRVAVARTGIYRAAGGETRMREVFRLTRGSRPLHMCATPDEEIVFGEYGGNRGRHEMFIYVSRDRGRSFEPVFRFPPGAVRHIHNVLYDRYLDAFWVLAGDYGHEPGIALLSRDFSHLDWIVRGTQDARVVSALVERDALVYGTDTELEQNYIVRLEKKTGRRERLAPIGGSSLSAARYGEYRFVSTAVTPSPVNPDRAARLFVSRNGGEWSEFASYDKDLWHPALQYGSIVLAPSRYGAPLALFSGQAVRGFDDHCSCLAL
jgi:hypothetical protein